MQSPRCADSSAKPPDDAPARVEERGRLPQVDSDREAPAVSHGTAVPAAMELMGALARSVAHDFRNVLQAIALASDELALASAGGEGDAVVASLRDALRLGSDLLATLHALSGEGAKVRARAFDGAACLARCERLLPMLLRPARHVFVRPGTRPVWLHGDEGQFLQLVLALAFRARDAMARDGEGAGGGGTITIALEVDRGTDEAAAGADEAAGAAGVSGGALRTELVVRDDGVVLSAAELATFFDGVAGEDPRDPGAPRSLAALVRALDGWAEVHSPPLPGAAEEASGAPAAGRGCEVRVALPGVSSAAGERATAADAAPWLVAYGLGPELARLVSSAARVVGLHVVHRAIPLLGSSGAMALEPPVAALWVDLDALGQRADGPALLQGLAARHRAVAGESAGPAAAGIAGPGPRPALIVVAGVVAEPLRGEFAALVDQGAVVLRQPVTASSIVRMLTQVRAAAVARRATARGAAPPVLTPER